MEKLTESSYLTSSTINPRQLTESMGRKRNTVQFCETVRNPLANYLKFLGVSEQNVGNRYSKLYIKFLIICLIAACLRRACQISRAPGSPYISLQVTIFDPNVIITFCRFTFFAGSVVCLVSFQRSVKRRRPLLEAINVTITPENVPVFLEKVQKTVCSLVWFSGTMTIMGGLFEISYRTGLFGMNAQWAPPLIGGSILYSPIDVFLTAIGQSSIIMMAADFFVSCELLRYLVLDVCIHMQKSFKDSPTLVKLHHLDEIQSHHFGLILAKNYLEDCYSFTVFIYYSLAVPSCCFMAYIAYRNDENNTAITISLFMWITSTIILLLILSIPAFQLAEEGESLLTSAFEMYQRCLKGEDDGRISTQFSILTTQIHSHPMIISAYNYFPMNRAMLLSMFSVIFTYFLILVQFSEEGKEIQAVLDTLKNVSTK